MTILVGNCICLIGNVVYMVSGLGKGKQQILMLQALFLMCMCLGYGFLGAWVAVIGDIIGIGTRLLAYKGKLNIWFKILSSALFIAVSLVFNPITIVNMLPIISIVAFTFLMDTKDKNRLRIYSMLTLLPWFIYDFHNMAYTNIVINGIAVVIYTIGIIKTKIMD